MIVNEYPTLRVCRVDFKTYILLIIKKFFFKSVKYNRFFVYKFKLWFIFKEELANVCHTFICAKFSDHYQLKKSTNADVF